MDKIKQKARNIKKKYATTSPFDICEEMGITLFYSDLPETVNGLFFKCLKNYVIIVNEALSYEECRVTVAHELGHILLHGSTNSFQLSTYTDLSVEKLEQQADYFASCLLIDEQEIESAYYGSPITMSDIASISRLPVSMVELYARRQNELRT